MTEKNFEALLAELKRKEEAPTSKDEEKAEVEKRKTDFLQRVHKLNENGLESMQTTYDKLYKKIGTNQWPMNFDPNEGLQKTDSNVLVSFFKGTNKTFIFTGMYTYGKTVYCLMLCSGMYFISKNYEVFDDRNATAYELLEMYDAMKIILGGIEKVYPEIKSIAYGIAEKAAKIV